MYHSFQIKQIRVTVRNKLNMRQGESTFYNTGGGSSSKGLLGMAQNIQKGKYADIRRTVKVDRQPRSKIVGMVSTSRNHSKKTLFSDRFEGDEITRKNETLLTSHIQKIERLQVIADETHLPMTHQSSHSKMPLMEYAPSVESRDRHQDSKHQMLADQSMQHSLLYITAGASQYSSPRWKMNAKIGMKTSPKNITPIETVAQSTVGGPQEFTKRGINKSSMLLPSPSQISQNMMASKISLNGSQLNNQQSYANTLSPRTQFQSTHYKTKQPVDQLMQKFERKRIMSPSQFASFNQTTVAFGGPGGLGSKASLNDRDMADDNVRADVHFAAESSLTKKRYAAPQRNFKSMADKCKEEQKVLRMTQVGRSKNVLSPRGKPFQPVNQRSVSTRKGMLESNAAMDMGAREFTLPQIPVNKQLGEKRRTIPEETDGGTFMTGVKRQSVVQDAKMDMRDRKPLERTGETFGNLAVLNTANVTPHQTSEIIAPMAGPGTSDQGSPQSLLRNQQGIIRLKSKRNTVSEKKTSGAVSPVEEKKQEPMEDPAKPKPSAKALAMLAALTKMAANTKEVNLPVVPVILLKEGSAAETFYAARPEAIRRTLAEQRPTGQTMLDERSQSKIVKDPLLLSLANIRNSVEKSKKNQSNKDADQVQKQLNLLMGEQPLLLRNLSRKLNRKMFSKLKKAFTEEDGQNVFQKFARDIRERKNYLDICKQAEQPAVIGNNVENQMFRYFLECTDKKILCLPILFKIINLKLTLNEYHVAPEMCDSLAEVLKQFPYILEKVNLHRNGLKDQQLGNLIEAFEAGSRFTSLVIKHNEFYQCSMDALGPILSRPLGSHLEELKLVSCKTSPAVIDTMLDQLSEHCHLQKLGLVQAQLGNSHIDKLRRFIADSKFLKELDLSWNELGMKQMLDITKELASNRTLKFVNLSWNYLTSSDKQTPIKPQDEELNEHLKQMTKMSEVDELDINNITKLNYQTKLAIYTKALEHIESKNPMKKHNEQIIANLSQFIKRNKNLHHLNLDSTQLSEYMLFMLCKCLTRAQSLLALHASGNPGISVELKEILWRRIRAKDPHEKMNIINFEKQKRNWKASLSSTRREKALKESLEVRAMAKRAPDQGGLTEIAATSSNTKLIFTRYLGHRLDIPGSGQWTMLNDQEKCWICENYVYCLFFWNLKTGKAAENDQNGMEEEEIIQKVEDANENTNAMENWTTPNVMSQFGNWNPKAMSTLKQYCMNIDRWKPNFVDDLQKDGRIREELTMERELDEEEREVLAMVSDKHMKDNYNTFEQLNRVFENSVRYKTCMRINIGLIQDQVNRYVQETKRNALAQQKEMIRKKYEDASDEDLDYESRKERDQFKNKNDGDESDEIGEVHVYPCFLKPGKTMFLVGTESSEFYLHRFLVPQRIDPVPDNVKELRTLVRVRNFERQNSVFKDWIEDNSTIIGNCMDHDLALWKIDRLIKNDEADKLELVDYIRTNGEFIKNLFIQIAARSNYPQILTQNYVEAVHKFNILDKKHLEVARVNTSLIAAKTNDVKFESGHKIDGQLVRFEFIETLVRIADIRFKQSGEVDSFTEAFQMLLEEYISPNYKDEPWTDFRLHKLWTLEVNDVFFCNYQYCIELMKRYHGPRKKTFTFQDANQMFLNDISISPPFINTEIQYAWGMSQMTIPNEKKNYDKYNDMKTVEFLEFLGRMAELRFPVTTIQLENKVVLLMEILFPQLLKKTPNTVENTVEEDSESDDDY